MEIAVKNRTQQPDSQARPANEEDSVGWLEALAAKHDLKLKTEPVPPKVKEVPFEFPVRILIADPNQRHRANYRSMLMDEPDLQIVGEAENGVEAVALADNLQPQLVIYTISLPGLNGIGMAKTIHERHPLIRMVCCTRENDSSLMRAAALAGGRDYLTFPIFKKEFVRTLRAACSPKQENSRIAEMNIRQLEIELSAMDRPVIKDPSRQLSALLLQEGRRILNDGEVVDPGLEFQAAFVLMHEDVRGIWWSATCDAQKVLAAAACAAIPAPAGRS